MSTSRMIAGLILIILGLSFLFNINIWSYLGPLILIIIGLRIMTKPERGVGFHNSRKVSQDSIDETVIFSSISRQVDSEDFEGGKFVTIFGEGKLDLSKVKTKNNSIDLEAVAIFGTTKVVVPRNWKIKSEGVGVLGSYENKTENNEKEKIIDLRIKGAAIFGEVELIN